jgi:hypothetical protein
MSKEMTDAEKVFYLIKAIDYLMDASSTDEMHDRMDNVVYSPAFNVILEGCEPKPRFLVNF